ncbi:histone deacetylase [Shewanella amazonensis]|uniref:Histone deacetylase/AcuC/AphA family protein n=1 Tax=Shewanella amazonensis (strain ATCC BAA-1098 / SB2B) TaxID=326297 RepID=A1S4Z6_SHEAM|nr:histone deacetylase [Shewanella amazonensis]ABL99452.1 histone deacetylase/AcuC/AphA family protein [Shewanella amazonensis SB2B]
MIPLVYHTSYSKLVLPPKHQFPITKYAHLRQHLLEYGHALEAQFVSPDPVDATFIKGVHDSDYVDAFLNGTLSPQAIRRLGFPLSHALVERTLHSLGGSLLTAKLAMSRGIALHLAGGYHHAHRDFGSGYCVFNDLVLAARHLIDEGHASRVMILDCDVHQGDGTATLCADMDDIISVSVHCDSNFPSRKPASDYDVPLPKGLEDDDYLDALEQVFQYLLHLEKPDVILYDAGVDVHHDDRLGHLNISTQGLLRRDKLVITMARNAGLPLAAVIGGGYSANPLHLSERHSQLFIAANQVWQGDNE